MRVVAAIQRLDMFPYGTLSGDHILAEGDDETSRVLSLPKPLYFYGSHFSQLYVSNVTTSLTLICMLLIDVKSESQLWYFIIFIIRLAFPDCESLY